MPTPVHQPGKRVFATSPRVGVAAAGPLSAVHAAALPARTSHDGFTGAAPTPPLLVELDRLGPGRPLPAAVLADHERHLGHDFRAVRVHTDEDAAALATGLGARAFTRGAHIVFAAGRYRPRSVEGRALLAHELGHVVEQVHGAEAPRIRRQPQEMDWGRVADSLLAGLAPVPASLRGRLVAGLQALARVASTHPVDFQQMVARGVRVRPGGSGPTATGARYEAVTRTLALGASASADAIADALDVAWIDAANDPRPAGAIQSLPPARRTAVVSERTAREQALAAFIRGMTPAPAAGAVRGRTSTGHTLIRPGLQAQLRIALRAFSTGQLQRMRAAGVRLWRTSDGLPPGYDVAPCQQGSSPFCVSVGPSDAAYRVIPPSQRTREGLELNPAGGGRASYQPQFRLVALNLPDNQLHDGDLRHELAHAWDDVRNDRTGNPASMSRAARKRFVQRVAAQRARNTILRRPGRDIFFSGERGQGTANLPTLYQHYRQRVPGRQFAFDSSARQGHSMRNPQEFYAEGYNVFHGRDQHGQARLLRYAAELYDLLEREARSQGRAIPTRATLLVVARQDRLPPPRSLHPTPATP